MVLIMTVFAIAVNYGEVKADLGHGRIRRVVVSREWAKEGLRCVEEPGEHLAT